MTSRFMKNVDITSTNGTFLYLIPFMLIFLVTNNEILSEKEKKLRQGVNVMGMSHNAYWTSWLLTEFVMIALMSLNLILCGYLF